MIYLTTEQRILPSVVVALFAVALVFMVSFGFAIAHSLLTATIFSLVWVAALVCHEQMKRGARIYLYMLWMLLMTGAAGVSGIFFATIQAGTEEKLGMSNLQLANGCAMLYIAIVILCRVLTRRPTA